MIPPCYHCPHRHLGCHATCHEYLDWCRAHGEALERRREYKTGMSIFWESVRRQFEQERRSKRRSRKTVRRER
jgi:hypothetical protein